MTQAMLAGRFAKMRCLAVDLVAPYHRVGRVVAERSRGVLLVELFVLVAFDPGLGIIAVQVMARCLGGDLDAKLEAQKFEIHVLSEMHRDVEQLPRTTLAHQGVQVLGVPVKHANLQGRRGPVHMGT